MPRRIELALATVVGSAGLGEIWVPFTSRQGHGSPGLTSVAVVLAALGLLWSRRRAVVAMVVFAVANVVVMLIGSTFVLFYGQFVPFLITVFMTARFASRRAMWAGAGLAAGVLLGIDLFIPLMQDTGEIVFHWSLTFLIFWAGFGLRTWEARARESHRRAVAAEVESAEKILQAAIGERTRIARELHDIVAHAVTSMVVQAGAAEAANRQPRAGDDEFVSAALASIRTTGTDALAEMRRLVTMLREEGDETDMTPQPKLAALPDLVEHAGVPTTLTIQGDQRPLPVGLDLAAYRIVQEGLTNVRRHSGAAQCQVVLTYSPEELRVEVRDDGDCSDSRTVTGHGLVGMQERVALYGGSMVAAPLPKGGFLVSAALPLPS